MTAFVDDVGNMNALANLPTELVWTIFEYAHESVSELRLVRVHLFNFLSFSHLCYF